MTLFLRPAEKRANHALRAAALLLAAFAFTATPASAQTTVGKEDGRFIAKIDRNVSANEFNLYGGEIDTRGFIDSFQLVLEWWTLLGEPIEMYHILWQDTDRYEVDGRWVRRSDLEKYPDLLRRFDALRPSKMDIRLSGYFEGPNVDASGLEEFARWGRYGYAGSKAFDFAYVVADRKLLYTRSGKMGSDIVPRSPRDWEYFLQYKAYFGRVSYEGVTDRENNGLNGLEDDATEAQKEARRRSLRKVFRDAERVTLFASLSYLEWPETEMRAIADKYDRYEQGEDEPSPEEQVAAAQDEVEQTGPYQGDDYWADPSIVAQFELDEEYDGRTVSEGVISINGTMTSTAEIETGTLIAESYRQEFSIDHEGRFEVPVVLKSGQNVIRIEAGGTGKNIEINLDREPSKFRATLTWDTSGSDIDLHVYGPHSAHCYYGNKAAGGMRLDVDDTNGYGPENIYATNLPRGNYRIAVRNYSGGVGTTAQVHIFVDEQLVEMKEVTFRSSSENIVIGEMSF